jgi:hypothetical protein
MNKNKFMVLILAGAISLAFGIINAIDLPESEHDLNMLMGMFTGVGAALIAIGVIRLVRLRLVSPEKLKQGRIEQTDERNVQILRIAYTYACVASTVLFAVMAFLFVYLGYRTPAFISIGALYIQILVFFIASAYYRKKM